MANHKGRKKGIRNPKPHTTTLTDLKELAARNLGGQIQELRKRIQTSKAKLEACERRLKWKIECGQLKQVRQLMNRRQRLVNEQGVFAAKLSELLERKGKKDDQERAQRDHEDAQEDG